MWMQIGVLITDEKHILVQPIFHDYNGVILGIISLDNIPI